ncbi:hypothetical protein N9S60_00175 [bacterium]|nr:hypothetical protein [bacterium]
MRLRRPPFKPVVAAVVAVVAAVVAAFFPVLMSPKILSIIILAHIKIFYNFICISKDYLFFF